MADDTNAVALAADSAYIARLRDYADICQLQKATVAEQFLEEPLTVIAECVSGWLRLGTKELLLVAPRVALAALRGKAFEQFGREFDNWRKSGRIPDDYAEKKHGYPSLAELLAEIDSNPTDEDRLEALKAMFFNTNRANATEGQRTLSYQLFQIAKRLNSGELLLLNAVFQAFKAKSFQSNVLLSQNVSNWRSALANKLGHGLSSLIRQQERALAEYNLITPIVMSGQLETIVGDPSRLTDLGIRFCENIESYRIEVGAPRTQAE